MTSYGEKAVVLSGIGQSAVGRRLGRTAADLTIEACRRAIEDAGLSRGDIDGMATFPGPGSLPPGMSGPGIYEVQDALRLELSWYSSGLEVPGQFGAIFNACNAIAAGVARHVLVYRTVTEGSAAKAAAGQRPGMDAAVMQAAPWLQWLLPFHGYTAVNLIALQAQRHMHDFGTKRGHLGALAVHARRMAAQNPVALYREPLSLDEYLAARLISSPLALYDCDVPCDGSTAFVLSSEGCAGDIPRPLRFEAVGSASGPRPYWEHSADLNDTSIHRAATHLWTRTDLKPDDVDVAELYDGFTFLTLLWLEALFCGVGHGGDFIGDGSLFAPDGDFPLNTDGGQLAAGRLHGFGKLYAAAVQLRNEACDRQVPEAEVAMVSAGGAVGAGCLLLTR